MAREGKGRAPLFLGFSWGFCGFGVSRVLLGSFGGAFVVWGFVGFAYFRGLGLRVLGLLFWLFLFGLRVRSLGEFLRVSKGHP